MTNYAAHFFSTCLYHKYFLNLSNFFKLSTHYKNEKKIWRNTLWLTWRVWRNGLNSLGKGSLFLWWAKQEDKQQVDQFWLWRKRNKCMTLYLKHRTPTWKKNLASKLKMLKWWWWMFRRMVNKSLIFVIKPTNHTKILIMSQRLKWERINKSHITFGSIMWMQQSFQKLLMVIFKFNNF